MGISKLVSNKSFTLFCGGFIIIFFIGCSNSKSIEAKLQIAQTDSICNFYEFSDNANVDIEGTHPILFQHVPTFLAYLKTRDTLGLLKISDGTTIKGIPLLESAMSLCSNDSVVYVFYENKDYYSKIVIHDSISNTISNTKLRMSSLFNNDFFISSSKTCNVFYVDSIHFLMPYKVRNEYKNLLDTFAYIYYDVTNANNSYKFLQHPNQKSFDFVYRPVTDFDKKSGTFVYGFQKSDTITVANLNNKKLITFKLDKLHTIEFPKEKIRNLTYIRQYLKLNDRVDKVFYTANQDVYVILKHHEKSKFKYRIYFYQSNKELLYYEDLSYKIYPRLSFLKKNQLHVPNEKNGYSIFDGNHAISMP
jgi:hypothetical protein